MEMTVAHVPYSFFNQILHTYMVDVLEISPVTKSIKFACRPIVIHQHDVVNDVIMTRLNVSLNVTAAIARISKR